MKIRLNRRLWALALAGALVFPQAVLAQKNSVTSETVTETSQTEAQAQAATEAVTELLKVDPKLEAQKRLDQVQVDSAVASATSFRVSAVEQTAKTISKGDEFVASLLILNPWSETIGPIEARVQADEEVFALREPDKVYTMTLEPGGQSLVEIPLIAQADLIHDAYALTWTLTDSKTGATREVRSQLRIVDDVAKTDADQIPGLKALLEAIESGKVTIIVGESAPGGTADDPNTTEIPNTPSGGSSDMTMSNMPEISGGGDAGGGVTQISGSPVKNMPKLIINNYALEPKMPQAGKEFTLNLSFYNTNSTYSVRNIKISLMNESPSASADGTAVGGSVFTPVNSSNTFYISKINPGDTASKSLRMAVVPNAAAQNYTITAHFEYEDKNGNQFTASEIIGVPVVQVARIDTSEVSLMDGGGVGMPSTIDVDFYNTGKDTLTNMMVQVEGDNFTLDGSGSYFVGNFQPGSSDHYSVNIIPSEEGPYSGKVVFTYEDSTGAEQRLEKAFEGVAMAGMDMGEMLDENGNPINMYEEPPNAGIRGKLPWLVGAVLIIAIVVVVLKRRKQKQEETELKL